MPMGFPPVPSYHQHPMSRLGYFSDPSTTAAAAVAAAAAIRQPNSPESISSSSPPTPSPPPPSTISSNSMTFSNGQVLTTQAIDTELINPLVPSSSTSSTSSSSASTHDAKSAAAISNNAASATPSSNNGRFNNPTTARVKEMITRANSVPMEFYHTEFLEYSKETYEKKMENKRNKRKRPACSTQQDDVVLPQEQKHQNKKKKITAMQELKEDSEEELDEEDNEFRAEEWVVAYCCYSRTNQHFRSTIASMAMYPVPRSVVKFTSSQNKRDVLRLRMALMNWESICLAATTKRWAKLPCWLAVSFM